MRLKQFFRPLYSIFGIGGGTTFMPFPGYPNAKPPVNSTRSYSGQEITPSTAMTLSAVWACTFRYANTISTLPLKVMQNVGETSAKPATKHSLYTVLHDRPNASMSASAFWQAFISSMMTWGVGYARKHLLGGRVVALDPLRPEYMTPYLAESGFVRYRYTPSGATPEDFSAEEIFVVIERTLDGYTPMSRIEYARNSMGLALGAEKASGLAYRNGLRVSGFLTIANWLNSKKREEYRQAVQEFMGVGSGADTDRQGGVMLLENATKFEPASLKPQDIELLASRQFSVEDVCRWYDIPPILIGHAAAGQTMWGSGVEQLILGWQKLGLAPILRRIEQEVWRQLFTPSDRTRYFAEFTLDALMRGDSQARAAFYSTMAQNGVYTRNEIRARENLPPMEGGDELTVQSNLVLLGKLGEEPEPAPEPPTDEAPDDEDENEDTEETGDKDEDEA